VDNVDGLPVIYEREFVFIKNRSFHIFYGFSRVVLTAGRLSPASG
jgi:hypothetical protein